MRKALLLAGVCLLPFAAFSGRGGDAKHRAAAGNGMRPRLVVGLVIDQMRWDYLYRYYDRYGTDGFRRLLRDGFECRQTLVNYLPSYTAPGHACIYTGSVPAIHGIASNDWVDNRTGRWWYCTEDTTVLPAGGSYEGGRMSPRNLLATTVTDELKLATGAAAHVYGVALKDRGGIIPAGHMADGAFWFDDSTGHFVTSTYYMSSLPGWLQQFNSRGLADSLLAVPWELLYPAKSYHTALPDDNPYEGLLPGEKRPVFPHRAARKPGESYKTLRFLPAGNTFTLEMARACVAGEKLGQQDGTDFLCISLSAPDYIGHMYSPDALETEDMYLRLDREIAGFLDYLDKKTGKGNYLLFLTADHGGAHNANFLRDRNIPAGNISSITMLKELNAWLKAQTGIGSAVITMENAQVYFDEKKIAQSGGNRAAIRQAALDWLRNRDEVAFAIDLEHPERTPVPEPVRTMVINGYHPQRSGSIQFILRPGWYNGYTPTGTTHGAWNPYDTHIPLLWYGWNIPAGATSRTIYMTDIAPTLSALLHIQMPNGCIGKAIRELAPVRR